MEEQFKPLEKRFDDRHLISINEKNVAKLAKKGTKKRDEQDKLIEKIACRVCHQIVTHLTGMFCLSCRFLICKGCHQNYEQSVQARNEQMICDCEKIREKLKQGGMKTLDGKSKIKPHKLGKFYDLIDDSGQIRLGLLNYVDLRFICRFGGCPKEMTYYEFIDDQFHKDCDYRRYQCQKCKKVVKKSFIQNHILNECQASIATCDYCKADIGSNDEDIKAHLIKCDIARSQLTNQGTTPGMQPQQAYAKDRGKDEEKKGSEEVKENKSNSINNPEKIVGQKQLFSQRFQNEEKQKQCEKCRSSLAVQGFNECHDCLKQKNNNFSSEKILSSTQKEALIREENLSLKRKNQDLLMENEELKQKIKESLRNLEEQTESHRNTTTLLRNLLQEKTEEVERIKKGEQSSIVDYSQANCVKCEFKQVDLSDKKLSFCKDCVRQQILEGEDFMLLMQCDECQDAIQLRFVCSCARNIQKGRFVKNLGVPQNQLVIKPGTPSSNTLKTSNTNEFMLQGGPKFSTGKMLDDSKQKSLNFQNPSISFQAPQTSNQGVAQREYIPNRDLLMQNQWQSVNINSINRQPLLTPINQGLQSQLSNIPGQDSATPLNQLGENDLVQLIPAEILMHENSSSYQVLIDEQAIENQKIISKLVQEVYGAQLPQVVENIESLMNAPPQPPLLIQAPLAINNPLPVHEIIDVDQVQSQEPNGNLNLMNSLSSIDSSDPNDMQQNLVMKRYQSIQKSAEDDQSAFQDLL